MEILLRIASIKKRIGSGVGEVAQWLRALVLSGDLRSSPAPIQWFIAIYTLVPMDPMPSSDLRRHQGGTHSAQTYMQAKHLRT